MDERLGFGELITKHLSDARRGKNSQLPLADLFRQSLYSRIAGCEDVNDAERISVSREAGVGKVSEGRVEVGPWGSPQEQNWPFRGLWKQLALQIRLTIAFGGGEVCFMGRTESP